MRKAIQIGHKQTKRNENCYKNQIYTQVQMFATYLHVSEYNMLVSVHMHHTHVLTMYLQRRTDECRIVLPASLQACIVINNRRQRQRRGRLTDDEYRSGEIQIQFQIQRN